MSKNMINDTKMDFETVQSKIERIMLDLPADKSKDEHKMYLAGIIDAHFDLGHITEETREKLYNLFTS